MISCYPTTHTKAKLRKYLIFVSRAGLVVALTLISALAVAVEHGVGDLLVEDLGLSVGLLGPE